LDAHEQIAGGGLMAWGDLVASFVPPIRTPQIIDALSRLEEEVDYGPTCRYIESLRLAIEQTQRIDAERAAKEGGTDSTHQQG
jgi:hypothetical protein